MVLLLACADLLLPAPRNNVHRITQSARTLHHLLTCKDSVHVSRGDKRFHTLCYALRSRPTARPYQCMLVLLLKHITLRLVSNQLGFTGSQLNAQLVCGPGISSCLVLQTTGSLNNTATLAVQAKLFKTAESCTAQESVFYQTCWQVGNAACIGNKQ